MSKFIDKYLQCCVRLTVSFSLGGGLLDNFDQFLMFLHQDGSTPLILAAQMSRVELCALLLGRGANANIQDNEGR